MKRCYPILLYLLWAAFPATAQLTPPDSPAKACGTDEYHAYRMKADAGYRLRYLQTRRVLDSLKRVPAAGKRWTGQIFTIPVVVHVIHLGEAVGQRSNISDEQILGAIDGLNARYANANGQGEDMDIRFCLATRDPAGCPTSGINRVDGSVVPGYRETGVSFDGSCGVEDRLVKDLSKWPTTLYYNIWVVHDICGSIAGYAYYPNGDPYDGTVIDIVSMRYDNLTLAHELGHGLNIAHTFSGSEDGNCPSDGDCLTEGDGICDTPPHRVGDCGLTNPCTAEGVWANSYRNWMSYCFPPNEEGRFTPDQRSQMWGALAVEPRLSLLSSAGCANAEAMRITSDGSLLCPREGRPLTAQPPGGYFQIAEGSGYIRDNMLFATGGSQITLEYVIAQAQCTSSVFQEIPLKAVPTPALQSAEDTVCVGQETLLQGFPAGGTYALLSGPGELTDRRIAALGEGTIIAAYARTVLGCILRDTQAITVLLPPDVEVSQIADDLLSATPDTGSFQWVRCDLGYAHVPEASSAILNVPATGTYAVIAARGSCRDTSDCLSVALTGTLAGFGQSPSRVYPNPANDICYVEGLPSGDRCTFVLADARGVVLPAIVRQVGNRRAVDLSSLDNGVYFLFVQIDGVQRQAFSLLKM